ncbi:MAG: multidrug effflux MFS transporter [Pseudomonadota bacterium]
MANFGPPQSPPSTPPHISTLVILAGLAALTMNIFLPSLPAMAVYFETDYGVMQLSVALFLAINACFQLIIGPLSDHFGRRPVILGGIIVFLIATLGTLIAPTIELFLIARMLQATMVVGLVLSRAIVRDIFPQDQAASMIGYVTMGMAVVPMIGPALGGFLQETFGWKANFWLLFLFGCLILYLCYRDLGETAKGKGRGFRAQIQEYPALVRSQRFWGYCLSSAFASGAFFSYLGGAPYVGSEVFRLDPTVLGLAFGTPAAGYFLGNWASGRFSSQVGINRMISIGCLITVIGLTISLGFFAIGLQTAVVFYGFTAFVGLGNGMVIPNATAGMLSVRPQLAGSASGLGGAIMIGGGAALSALAGVVLQPGLGAWPLMWLMLASAVLGLIAILFTIRREQIIDTQTPKP